MGVIMLNGIAYGGDNFFRLTQAEYDALTPYEQTHGNYCITDAGATGDLASNYVTYTSGDSADVDATSWSTVQPMESREGFAGLFNKISTMAKNVRYLKNLLNDNVWEDVTSEFIFNNSLTYKKVLYNAFTKEVKMHLVGTNMSSESTWVTIPNNYLADVNKLMPYSTTGNYFMFSSFVGRYTQTLSTVDNIHSFTSSVMYRPSTSTITVKYPLAQTGYSMILDLTYIVA